ncbi:MAG: T9SS type A sorting domain-containing protein, partial [Bacteroidota bacterium]
LTWVMTGVTTGSSPNTGINYVGTRTFNIGTTTITYTASNGGPTATCSFTVTVTDNTAASITCPANITNTQNGANKCSAVINIPNPNTSSNCSVTKLTWVMTGATTGSSPATGINYVGTKTFTVGITTITYTVTNGAGTTATCSLTVTVTNRRCPGSPAGLETGAPATSDKLNVTVSPNPSETYFTLLVQSSRTEDVVITIYTINGKLVQQIQGSVFESYRFGNSYTPGTYIVKVKQGNKETIVKVIR